VVTGSLEADECPDYLKEGSDEINFCILSDKVYTFISCAF
jgi:hypothetical protein